MTRRPLPHVRDDLMLVEGYHSPQVAVEVRLNTNESPYPPPPEWVDAVLEELGRVAFNRYPDRNATKLRTAIAELHGVAPDQVLAAKGSNEILQALCLAYGGPGRSVAVFEPTYALHSHIARVTGTAVVRGRRAEDFTLDADEVVKAAALDPTITFLCSPNNPTGVVDSPEAIEHVISRSPGLVVIDEAYAEFAPSSAASLVADDFPLVVTRTFSKAWSMAACRLGYMIGPAEVVEGARQALLPYHLDAASQIAGCLALKFVDQMVERVARIAAERERLSAALSVLAVDVWPSAANFILFRPRHRDATEVWKALVQRSVLVRNCAGWNPSIDGCLRVTVGTPAEDDVFLAALAEVL